MLAAAIVVMLLFMPGNNPGQPDFRKVTWGMTQQQVRAAESIPPVETREENGEVVLKYESVADTELAGHLIYIFANNKLVRAKYFSDIEHENLNDFIADFHASENKLREKLGKPTSERAVWEDDSLEVERLAYLDQDRALPSNILPSDNQAGLSVALGYLRLITERLGDRTKVVHSLSGADHQIVHQIEYRSLEFETAENELIGTAAHAK